MALTPIEIFLLGWRECLDRVIDARWDIPRDLTNEEIMKLITENQPKPKGPPYDVADMKEYPIG